MKVLAAEAFSRWKAGGVGDEIFREIIDVERNNILKEDRFSHHPLDEVHVAVSFSLRNSEGGVREVVENVPIGGNIYRPMIEGFREGDDAREVLSDAFDWWDAELGKLEGVVLAGAAARPAGNSKA